MKRYASFALVWCVCLFFPLATSAQFDPDRPFEGAGTLVMSGDTGDFVTGGRNYSVGPEDGTWSATVLDTDNDDLPDYLLVSFLDDDLGSEVTGGFWHLIFDVDAIPGAAIAVGTYDDAQRAGFADDGHPGLDVAGDGRGCNEITGEYSITAFQYDCVPGRESLLDFRLTNFAAEFEQHCEGGTPRLRGTISFTAPAGAACEGGGGGTPGDGGTPEPPPPPPVQFALPLDLDVQPLALTNSAQHVVKFRTAITSTFNSDLHLSVETDALAHEDLQATITPSVIAAPGVGEGELAITTGALTFPRVYSVKLIASANDQSFSRTFLVEVLCDPPFILGTNQPHSITAANGSQVTLEVTPSGTGPFFYQWYTGVPGMTRSPVLAANESTLIFTTRETASYWVRVSNACGTVNSTAATVTTTGTLSGPARRRGGG